MSGIEWLAFAVSVAGVWLTSRRHPACWPIGLVSVAMYAWVFGQARLYSDAILQGVFAVFLVYGWRCWKRAGGPAAADRIGAGPRVPIVHPQPRGLVTALLVGLGAAGVWGWVMAGRTDAALPYLDATLAGLSLVAQFWTARRYRINWLLWIAVDLVYIGMYLSRGLVLTAVLYALFVLLAINGWYHWGRHPGNPAEAPA